MGDPFEVSKAKTLKQQQLDAKKTEANTAIAAGAGLAGYSAATTPFLKTGRKKATSMTGASPKREAGRYQNELTRAMKDGKVPNDSTLRVFKTPSGRHLNAGGTHRHLAREALGQESKKIEIKPLGFEPRRSPVDAFKQNRKIKELKHGSKEAAKGVYRPVSPGARAHNKVAAAGSDRADDMLWKHGFGSMEAKAAKVMTRSAIGVGAAMGAGGAALAAKGINDRKKLSKSMSAHEAFLTEDITKSYRTRDTSVGRTATGSLFPGVHGAVAGKKGHKVKAAAYELGGGLLGATPGAAIGTHLASKEGHYKKLPKKTVKKAHDAFGTDAATPKKGHPRSTDVAAAGAGKKVTEPYPPEVKAYIAEKTAEVAKSHELILGEDIAKAYKINPLPALQQLGGAVRGGAAQIGQGAKAAAGAGQSGARKAGVARGLAAPVAGPVGKPHPVAVTGRKGGAAVSGVGHTTERAGTWALKPKQISNFTPAGGTKNVKRRMAGTGGLTGRGKAAVGGAGVAGGGAAGFGMNRQKRKSY